MIKERLALSARFVAEKSGEIQRRFMDLKIYKDAHSVAIYSDFKGEVQTGLILKQGINDGKVILMPRLSRKNFSMSFFSILSEQNLGKNREGFKEPVFEQGQKFENSEIDLVVVPGVAFDVKGQRVGLGKGYYDRALKEISRDKIVAIAYEFQVLQEVPSCHHDVGVGWIVTEERCLKVGNKTKEEKK